MRNFWRAFRYLVTVHVAGLLLLSLFRLVLFFKGYAYVSGEADPEAVPVVAFLRGIWFDNVVACYVLLLPLLVVSVAVLFNYGSRTFFRIVNGWFIFFYTWLFLISAADIPYFAYFFKHLNASIFNWMSYGGTTLGMMFSESSYYSSIVLFLVATALFVLIAVRACRKAVYDKSDVPDLKQRGGILVMACLLVGLCLFGIRGRMGYNPIKVSAAYYCGNPFLNQLGISPAFNLLRSTLEASKKENQYIRFMDEAEALAYTKKALKIENEDIDERGFVRHVAASDTVIRPNVVLVFMESMSADFMARYGNTENLTPFLDSLARQSICFDSIFSAGIHTNHGVYATLYSYPAIMKRNAMKGAVIQNYTGLPTLLQNAGYRTLYFMTHESQYDNMNGFFRTNGYDEIYAQEDYPSDKVVNSFGVQDDFLFEYALPVLTRTYEEGVPFFATLMTVSNHPPYVIPSSFLPRSTDTEKQIVEYADWAMRRFMDEASRQPWFDHTIFVFLADHGKLVGEVDSEMPLSYNHIPLMFYSPLLPSPRTVNVLGGQIDVAPTLLGIMGWEYENRGLGVDLLREERPCIFFTADDAVGCIDDTHFYIYRPAEEQEWLYATGGKRWVDAAATQPDALHRLKTYALSMLQSAEYLVSRNLTSGK